MILMASLDASAVPPPGPVAVEVVGGVEAAVEPAQDVPKGEAKEDLPLSPGDSILRDIGFDPLSEDYEDRVKGLFLDPDQLEEALNLIADLEMMIFARGTRLRRNLP